MKRKFKTKNKNIIKYVVYLLIILFSFYFTLSILMSESLIIDLTKKYVLKDYNIVENLKNKFISPNNVLYNSLNKGIKYDSITAFNEMDIYFDYDEGLSSFVEEIELEEEKSEIDYSKPIIYIYNTHQLEEYHKNKNNEFSIAPNVMYASYMLKEKLSSYKIPSIVETHSIKKYLNKYGMSYLESYDASRYYIKNTLKKYKTIDYIIDLHRDALPYDYSYVTYKGKKYAKIMFVIGLGNRNYKYNLNLAKKLNKMFESRVPGITRNITKYPGDETNAVYNQDQSKNAILIEVGGNENRIEEVNNTLDVFSDILNELINGDNNEKKEE